MKTIESVPKPLVKRKLVEAYNSSPEIFQIDLFDSLNGPQSLAYQCQSLFKYATQLIEDGQSPAFLYAMIISLSRDEIIILHPAYQINSINDFWMVIDSIRKETF